MPESKGYFPKDGFPNSRQSWTIITGLNKARFPKLKGKVEKLNKEVLSKPVSLANPLSRETTVLRKEIQYGSPGIAAQLHLLVRTK